MTSVWDGNAQIYESYAQRYPLYRTTAAHLCEIAAVQPGMEAVDAACGTGICTEILLTQLAGSGHVTGVDSSRDMLDEARKKCPNATFLLSPADELDRVLPPDSVDVIICNCAFWQFQTERALVSIHRVLKSGGCFVFDLPDYTQPDPFGAWIRRIADAEYGYRIPEIREPRRLSHTLIEQFAKGAWREQDASGSGFAIQLQKRIEIADTAESQREWSKIPIISENIFFGGLDYSTRIQVIERAYQCIDKQERTIIPWYFFVATKAYDHQEKL